MKKLNIFQYIENLFSSYAHHSFRTSDTVVDVGREKFSILENVSVMFLLLLLRGRTLENSVGTALYGSARWETSWESWGLERKSFAPLLSLNRKDT